MECHRKEFNDPFAEQRLVHQYDCNVAAMHLAVQWFSCLALYPLHESWYIWGGSPLALGNGQITLANY
jgi:hypothetical protein